MEVSPDQQRLEQDRLERLLRLFWHPVCTLGELAAARPHPLGVELLGRRFAVANVGTGDEVELMAVPDRCPHRSTRLSVGWVESGGIRCAYHGWAFDCSGRCREIPALDGEEPPARAALEAVEARVEHGLVWLRLDPFAGTEIPAHPAFHDSTMKVLEGTPYTWPTAAPRRVENFVDLSHFAWVHDGTLGDRTQPVPPIPVVRREAGELRFEYDPPDLVPEDEALFGFSEYRMPVPCTVDISFRLATGAHRRLWMTASPLDAGRCRTFWSVARDDDHDGDDAEYLAFQDLVLRQDEPVVCNQDPPEFPLEPLEVSVRTDRVSIEYRRWLRELAAAADGPDGPDGGAAVQAALAASFPREPMTTEVVR